MKFYVHLSSKLQHPGGEEVLLEQAGQYYQDIVHVHASTFYCHVCAHVGKNMQADATLRNIVL